MTSANIIDTLLNIMVFVFIGLLVWLFLKKEPGDPADTRDPGNEGSR
jgi:hypothetical protein